MADATYECECDLEPGEVRKPYRVTNHDGTVETVRYCAECAILAEEDWNGETASIGHVYRTLHFTGASFCETCNSPYCNLA